MRTVHALLALSLVACASGPPRQQANATAKKPTTMRYPASPRGTVSDDYGGTKIDDPYRWLEDPSTPETRAWITAQNELTFGALAKLPGRARWTQRLTELNDYERFYPPGHRGPWYVYAHNDGLQNHPVYYKVRGLTDAPQVLLDPNALAKDGTFSVNGTSLSDDGSLFAYSLSNAGSDWVEWHIRDVASGKELTDVIKWSNFSAAAFTHDGKAFYYSRYPEPTSGQALEQANYYHQLWLHRLGTKQSEDRLVYEDKEHKLRGVSGVVSDDGNYLVLMISEGTDRRTRLYYQDLKAKQPSTVRLLDRFDAAYDFVGNRGGTFFVLTDRDAPRGRLVAIDLKKPDPSAWRVVIPEGADKIERVHHLANGFVVERLHLAASAVAMYDEQGKHVRDVALPGIGNADGFFGHVQDTETFYSFSSFTTPATIYRLDLETGASTVFKAPKLKFDPTLYETQQVVFRSKDGTEVPMFLVGKKGLAKTGDQPTYLYGYGGFNISLQPEYSTKVLAWIERGYLYAQPSLRGGGEFGEGWHQAGMLDKKQNVFDDFAAAARWLVDNGYTKPSRIAISGRSNGGLLVGASITQHPELFGAAIAGVGVMDMLRFHKFTIGHAWVSEYGSSDDPAQLAVLRRYSPLHNVKPGTAYPPTIIVTGDHDDRVVPAHSFKLAAELQHAQAGPNPIYIRIDVATGHGAGKPLAKQIEEAADCFAFAAHALGAE